MLLIGQWDMSGKNQMTPRMSHTKMNTLRNERKIGKNKRGSDTEPDIPMQVKLS